MRPDLPTRLVLDTNTVLALWHFEDPALLGLRRMIDTGHLELATRVDALEELRRVLAYRQFAIDAGRQSDILDAYRLRCVQIRDEPATMPILPPCRDPDDQKFLEIARDAGASRLLSRDKLLLRLNRHRLVRPLFGIVTPESFCQAIE
ncbi:PIN domain-containing protein [Rhodocyclaceae bacterium SMB388]